MESLNQIVAQNLKRIRDEKKLSLEKVSELSGVSKTMLSQIERGESSPTISTVWKIANGLKTTFTELIEMPQPESLILSKEEVGPMTEDDGRYRLYPFFPYEAGRRFEVYTAEIDPGGYFSAEGHGELTQEFVTVFDGTLIIRVGAMEYSIPAGGAIRFKSEKAHAYFNEGATMVRLNIVIFYPR